MDQNTKTFFTEQQFSPVVNFDFSQKNYVIMDFSKNNKALHNVDLSDIAQFTEYIQDFFHKSDAQCGIGGYLEDRVIYQRSGLFDCKEEARSLHLGIDIWIHTGMQVYVPYDGVVHSFQDNAGYGDYGPTIILEHQGLDFVFYTLYGHLSRESLKGLEKGQKVSQGQEIATIGDSDVNGNWPSHLHFQVMLDILDKEGDFPGVSKPSEKDTWKENCIDPNFILRILHS